MRRCVVVWCCPCVARRQVPNASVPFHSLPFLSQHLGLDAQKGPGQQRHPITNFNERESNACSNRSQCFDPAPQTCSVRSKSLRKKSCKARRTAPSNKHVKPRREGINPCRRFSFSQSNWGTHTAQGRVCWLVIQSNSRCRTAYRGISYMYPPIPPLPGKQLRVARRRITHRRPLGGEGLQQCGRESTSGPRRDFLSFHSLHPPPGSPFFFRWFQYLVPKLCAGR